MTAEDELSRGSTPLVRIVPATVHGRHLVRVPAQNPPRGWLLGFHGYAQSAAEFLELLVRIPSSRDWLVASVQALHPFYNRTNEVVANWMTRQDREHAIADNIAYVDAVVAALVHDFGAPPALVFAGFSQGVAMAYRAGVMGSHPAATVFAVGGDLPPELKEDASTAGKRREWPAVMLCTGNRDAYYTPQLLQADLDFLRSRGVEARSLVFEGGHEWSEDVVSAADRILTEVG